MCLIEVNSNIKYIKNNIRTGFIKMIYMRVCFVKITSNTKFNLMTWSDVTDIIFVWPIQNQKMKLQH